MGLYDITIINANGGNELSLNKKQKKRTETEYLLKMSTVFWLYIVLIGIRNEIYKIVIQTPLCDISPFCWQVMLSWT
jgi:hypothetical protein